MEDTVTITKEQYLQTRIDCEILNRLEAGGVDNWEWYGDSLNPDGQPDLDVFEEIERARIAAL